MTTVEKISTYLQAVMRAETLEDAKMEARLALRLIKERKSST